MAILGDSWFCISNASFGIILDSKLLLPVKTSVYLRVRPLVCPCPCKLNQSFPSDSCDAMQQIPCWEGNRKKRLKKPNRKGHEGRLGHRKPGRVTVSYLLLVLFFWDPALRGVCTLILEKHPAAHCTLF